MTDSGIQISLRWWHIALIALAVTALLAYAVGWGPATIVGLLGAGASAKKGRGDASQSDPTDPVPDRPEPETTEPVTEYSEAVDDAEGAAADQEVEEMTTEQIEKIIEDGL